MPQLLAGKTALVLGVANKWSLAYAIAQAFHREGAKLLLTYQGERLKRSVEELGAELGAARIFDCDVTKDADLARLAERFPSSASGLAGVLDPRAAVERRGSPGGPAQAPISEQLRLARARLEARSASLSSLGRSVEQIEELVQVEKP